MTSDDFADEEDFTDVLPGSWTETVSETQGATAQVDADIDLYSGVGESAEDSAANQTGEAVQEAQRQQSVPQELKAQANANQALATQARPTSAAPTGPSTTSGTAVYIGNLQWWTTDADLESMCSKYGQILNLKTFEDKNTGKSKGYVLVHFAAPEAAVACQAELNSRDIHGKACVVTAAQSHGTRTASSAAVPVASTSGRIAPPVRAATANGGRGTALQQPMANGRGFGRSVAKSEAASEHEQYRQPPMGLYPAMGMGMGMHMGMGPPMGMGPLPMPGMGMGMGPMGMPMPLIPGMFQPPPPPRDSGRRPRSDYDGYDISYKRSRY